MTTHRSLMFILLAGAVGCASPVELAEAVDAGTPEPMDSGQPDSGADAGVPDQGEPDAGEADAGMQDGGFDAGSPDVPPLEGVPGGPFGGAVLALSKAGDVLVVKTASELKVSRDGGDSFQVADIGDLTVASIYSAAVFGDELWIGADNGLYVSIAGAAPVRRAEGWWSQVLVDAEGVLGVRNGGTYNLGRSTNGVDFEFLAQPTHRLFRSGTRLFALSPFFGSVGYSDDGGDTFTDVAYHNSTIPKRMTEHAGKLYVVSQGTGVWMSEDNGESYSLVDEIEVTDLVSYRGELLGAAASLDLGLVRFDAPSSLFVPHAVEGAPLGFYTSLEVVGDRLLLFHQAEGVFRHDAGLDRYELLPVDTALIDIIASDGKRIYAGQGSTVHLSGDGGETWVSDPTPIVSVVNSAVVALTAQPEGVLAALRSQDLLRSTDFGSSWTRIGGPRSETSQVNEAIRSLRIMPSGRIVVGYLGVWTGANDAHGANLPTNPYGGGVFVSDDGGASWIPRANAMPQRVGTSGTRAAAAIHQLELGPEGRLFAAIQEDRYRIAYSDDEGNTWSVATGPAEIQDNRLAVAATSERVVAGNVNGLYVSDDNGESFLALAGAPTGVLQVVADGDRLAVRDAGGMVWVSSDGAGSFAPVEDIEQATALAFHEGRLLVAARGQPVRTLMF